MKINQQQPLSHSSQVGPAKHNTRATPNSTPSVEHNEPAAITHLSQTFGSTAQDIDSVRVNEIRQAISEGRLEIHADRIADGLLNSLNDLLD